MIRKLNTNVSPASVLAMIALFVALGGGAYAAVGKIGTKEIKNGAITKVKIKKEAVSAPKIMTGAVTAEKIADNAVNGAKLDEATLGTVPSAAKADVANSAASAGFADKAALADAVAPEGVNSDAIAAGAVTAGKLGELLIRTETVTIPAEATDVDAIGCNSGEVRLSGGAIWAGSFDPAEAEELHLVYSAPTPGRNWQVRAYNGTSEPRDILLRVVCLAV